MKIRKPLPKPAAPPVAAMPPAPEAAGPRPVAAGLPAFSSTRLVTEMGAVTSEVMKRGGAVITRHDQPVMVLLPFERYAELERAATPDLDALSGEFDALYARMQAPGVAGRTLAALDLGARAVVADRKKTRRRA